VPADRGTREPRLDWMPYWIALVPTLACVGVFGTVVSLIRGRRRSALAFGIVGVGAIVYAIAAYDAAL
jgi:hypothetical protein